MFVYALTILFVQDVFEKVSRARPDGGVCGSMKICRGTLTIINVQLLLQMHNKKMFDLENEGQTDEAQRLQWCFRYL